MHPTTNNYKLTSLQLKNPDLKIFYCCIYSLCAQICPSSRNMCFDMRHSCHSWCKNPPTHMFTVINVSSVNVRVRARTTMEEMRACVFIQRSR